MKLALRPDKRFGDDAMWDTSERELREAVLASGLSDAIKAKFEELPGDEAGLWTQPIHASLAAR